MPIELAPGDRKLLMAAGIILVVLIGLTAVLSPPTDRETRVPSTYSSASGGAKAAFLLLKETGYRVERWDKSPSQLPDDAKGALLILADPFVPARDEERVAVYRFLERGGRVLVTGGNGRIIPEFEAVPEPEVVEWKDFPAQLPSPLTRGAPQIRMMPSAHWPMRRPGHLPLYAGDEGVVAVIYSVGRGEVLWWASATPLTNAGIAQSHNLEFFLDSVGEKGSVRVLWDEYFHGQQASLWAQAESTPIPYALAQLGLFAVAIVLTFSRRNGPVRMPRVESRLSPLEFVETLGALYRKAKAGPVAVEIALARLRFFAARRFGLPARASADDIARAVSERLGARDDDLRNTLMRAEHAATAPELSDAQALAMVRDLYQQAERLKQKPRRKAGSDGDSQPADGARTRRVEQSDRRTAAASR